jgi:hypothetical protein
VTLARARPEPAAFGAVFAGSVVGLTALVDLVRLVRWGLLSDPDPGWAGPRLLLGLGLAAAAGAAAAAAAGGFFLWSRSWLTAVPPGALPFPSRGVLLLAAVALCVGVFLRTVWLAAFPIPFIEDEINLVTPVLALSGTWRDFADAIRPVPYGVADPHMMIGVLYMKLFRLSLEHFGATMTGVRMLSFCGGVLSLATAGLLGRALLPRGGGTLTVLLLAGLRWHLILSRWGWHSIVLTPLVDIAALLLLTARKGRRSAPALGAGLVLGIGAHVYLASWAAGIALCGFALWPGARDDALSARARRALFFAAGFLLAAAPIFLFREGRTISYFGRAGRHNVVREMGYTQSAMPPLAAAADAVAAPWFVPDPGGWFDLPNRSRLGWIVGVPVFVALARALARPRDELSGFLLLHAAASFAAAVASGQSGHPNGFRFGYLSTITAVAASAGVLQLVALAKPEHRRSAAFASIGLLSISGVFGARDALLVWPEHRATFDSFHGEDTLLGRAAARWQGFGEVSVGKKLGRSDLTIETVRTYRLDAEPPPSPAKTGTSARAFRIARPGTPAEAGERAVERVRDLWGRDWAVILGRGAGG